MRSARQLHRVIPSAAIWRRISPGVIAVAVMLPFSTLDVNAAAARPHPVHISSTQIDLAKNSRSLEISVRMFTDDLEEALHATSTRRVRFGATPAGTLDTLVASYLAKKLKLWINGSPAAGRLLGHERDADAVLAFIEVPVTGAPKRVDIENLVMFELFSDQSNIVHVKIGDIKRNALLRRGEERAALKFD
jgi:hypothetical protein